MSDPSITLSSRGAFSYHWNKGIENNDPYFFRLSKSAAVFLKGLFCGYTVSESDIISIINGGGNKYQDSIFYKEYNRELAGRKVERVNDPASEEQSINGEELENNDKKKEPSADTKKLGVKTDKATKTKGVSVTNTLLDELEKLMSSNGFKSTDEKFSVDKLGVLEADDALRLFNKALYIGSPASSEIAIRLLSETECDKKLANLSGREKAYAMTFFSCKGFLDKLKTLLSSGNDEIDSMGYGLYYTHTPLVYAIKNGHKDCVELLLANKADVHKAGSRAQPTPIESAVIEGDVHSLNLLLKAGANPNEFSSASATKVTLLWMAVEADHMECFNLLMEQEGINVSNLGDQYSETPVECACRLKRKEYLRVLLAHPDIQMGGTKPLFQALKQGDLECLGLLLNHEGIDVNETDSEGVPLLLHFVRAPISLPCFKKFLDAQGLNLSPRGVSENTLLHYAASMKSKIDILNALLGKEAIRSEINATNTGGSTALHYATSYNKKTNTDIINALLAVTGIDVSVKNRHGKTALDYLDQFSPCYEACKAALETAKVAALEKAKTAQENDEETGEE